MLFHDRFDAGRQLARQLMKYAARTEDGHGQGVVVLALPRGGVPVGFEVAKALHAPLDVFLVRKLGVPGREELAMGAIASGGVRILNEDVVRALAIPNRVIDLVTREEQEELDRRERAYRGNAPPLDLRGRTVILVDDGLATGSTMRAAIAAVRAQHPARIVVAVPVGSADTCEDLGREAEEVVCAETPEPFLAVGMWYRDFSQTSDDEVRELLGMGQAAQEQSPAGRR